MKSMVLILSLVMFAASTSFAVIDPDDNSMGLYWDLTADTVCTPISYAPTDLHLILTNPTMTAINGFEAGFYMEGTAYILNATFPNPMALDVAAGFQNFIVGFGQPTTCTEATLLVTLSILNTASDDGLSFFLHEATPPSISGVLPVILLTDDTLVQVGTSTLPGTVNAYMGLECMVVATESATWDSVKSLYR